MADDLMIGKLIQQVANMERDVQTLMAKVEEISVQMNRGRGFAIGLFFAAGTVGAGLSSAWHKVFG